MLRWRPHLSWSCCVCWQAQSARHLAFLRQLSPSSKCLSSGFAGPQKQRVTSVYWYMSRLRLQGPVASRDVMWWHFIPGLGRRHLGWSQHSWWQIPHRNRSNSPQAGQVHHVLEVVPALPDYRLFLLIFRWFCKRLI